MPNERVDHTDRRRKWVGATCAALVLAAVADAGPEIVESGSLVAGYDGPGPVIYLGVAAFITAVRWHFVPLLAVAMSAFFIVGGIADADFAERLATPGGLAFIAAWVQMLGFAAAVVCGTTAVRRHRVGGPVSIR